MGKRLSLWSKSFGDRFRNTRTAAGFEPMPSKTQPDKMLPVTFKTHKKQFVWHPRCEAVSETIGASPLEAGSETLEQQQDSSPCQSKITRRSDIISANGLAWENACRFGASPLETGSETPEQQQDSSPCQAKRSPTKCFLSPLKPIKNSLSGTLGARLVPKPLAQVPWRPVPKHSNSNRIRAHAKQNAARQNASRHLWNP